MLKILFNFQEFPIKELVWLSPQWLTFLKFDRLVTGQRFKISRTLQRFSYKKAHNSSLSVEYTNYIAELEGMFRKEK